MPLSVEIITTQEHNTTLNSSIYFLQGKTLALKNIQIQSAGNYLCIADNTVRPPATHSIEVRVFYAPEVHSVQDSVGQAQNRRFNARLECLVTGKLFNIFCFNF